MKCNKKCIHHTVCELKKYDCAYIVDCKHYEEPNPHGKKDIRKPYGWQFCSECGKVLEPQDNFCWFCGADFRETDNNVPTVKSPCNDCIELECEHHGVVCPHYRVKETDNETQYIDANVILPMLTNKAHTMADRHGVKWGEPWLLSYDDIKEVIDKIPTAKINIGDNKKGEWIPIKTRPLTEEEKEEYPDCEFMYDCKLPEDGEEVLVTTSSGYVALDVFCRDDSCYFENYCEQDDVLAWQPLPKPYKENEKGTTDDER